MWSKCGREKNKQTNVSTNMLKGKENGGRTAKNRTEKFTAGNGGKALLFAEISGSLNTF